MYNQISKLIRNMLFQTKDIDIPWMETFHIHGFHVKFQTICFKLYVYDRMVHFNLEINVVRDGLRLYIWIAVNEHSCVHHVKIYGMEQMNAYLYFSIPIHSQFKDHLVLTKDILQNLFERIDIDKEHVHQQYSQNMYMNEFMQSLFQICGTQTRHTLSRSIRHRFDLIHASRHRHRTLYKHAWFTWLAHFYHPDTSHGYMSNRIKYFNFI